MINEVMGTLVDRWYVTLFGIAFVFLASRHIGWKRTGIYTVAALVVGIISENGAVRWGIPYTRYSFNEELRGNELYAGNVPLMVSLSYTFMSYFAFAAARLVVGGPYRTRSSMPVLEYLTAVMLGVWAIWLVDPVSRLGAHFFLGELFQYDGPGFWFGIPIGSQLGFTLTVGILVGILTWLMRDEKDEPVQRLSTNPNLGALLSYFGQIIFMAVTAFVVARLNSDPEVVKVADALAGSAVIIGLPAVLMTAVHWRTLTLAHRSAAASVGGDSKSSSQPATASEHAGASTQSSE